MSPLVEDWNACAAPWKPVLIAGGSDSRAVFSTAATASPKGTPGFTLKETVTLVICPKWFTDSGPRDLESEAMVESGTSAPVEDFTYKSPRADGSSRYCGSSSRITWYWFVGA